MSELDCAGNPSQKWGISERLDFVTGVISMDLIKHLEKAVRILPRFMAVFPYERGVFLRMGKCKRTLEPGLYFCMPIIDEIQKLDVTPQVINLPNQSITTKEGKTLAVSGAVEYSICDPQKALLEVQNFDASLQNLSMGIIGQYINNLGNLQISLETEVVVCNRSPIEIHGYISSVRYTSRRLEINHITEGVAGLLHLVTVQSICYGIVL